jgi:hypothetical protein
MMIALLLALQTVSVPPAVQRMADVNVLVGSCGRYMPASAVRSIDAVTRDASPEVRAAVAEWREAGRQARLDRPQVYNRSVCLRLYQVVGSVDIRGSYAQEK